MLRRLCVVAAAASAIVALGLCAVGWAQPDDREPQATASIRVYADDDHMNVISPRAVARAPLGERWSIEVDASSDVISGASVDVISEASPQSIDEVRAELALGTTFRPSRTTSLRARVRGSSESDYRSAGVELGGAIELGQRNTILDLGYAAYSDRVGAVTDPDFAAGKHLHRAAFTITQIVDRRTYVDVIVETSRLSGYLESPYRTVPIIDPASSALVRVGEAIPRVRWSRAAKLRVRRALGSWFVRASYCYYQDQWSVDSHTASITSIAPLHRRARLAVQLRGYLQGGAYFYRSEYTLDSAGKIPEIRTRERRLGPMRTLFGSVILDLAASRDPASTRRLILGLSLARFSYPEFRTQQERDAIGITVGLQSPL